MNAKIRKQIKNRSGGQCEIFVAYRGFEGRCTNKATEIHHMLTKGRGGEILDEFTDYHLIHLCSAHHRVAQGDDGYDSGLLIDGQVTTSKITKMPIYVGTDEYLNAHYGESA